MKLEVLTKTESQKVQNLIIIGIRDLNIFNKIVSKINE